MSGQGLQTKTTQDLGDQSSDALTLSCMYQAYNVDTTPKPTSRNGKIEFPIHAT